MDFLYHIVGESIALGLDSIILGICIKQLFKCRNVIFSLNNAPTFEINKDLKAELNKHPDKIIPYVVIRGLVKPLGNSIKSISNETISGVIQRLTVKEHVVARTTAGFWSHQSRTIRDVYNNTPFVLSGKKLEIEIVDALEANILDLDIISDRFEPLSPTLKDHIWGFFAGIHQRGLQTSEEMLRNGTYITAIGELNGNDSGLIKLQPPKDLPLYLTTTTKSSVLKKLGEDKDFLRILVIICGSIAVITSGRILFKYFSRKKRLREEENMKRILAVSRRERRAQAREKNLSEEAQLCVVCTENPKEIILLPCGHVSICEDCSDNIKEYCPVCRSPIVSKAPAFIT